MFTRREKKLSIPYYVICVICLELKELVNLHQQFDEENEEPLSIDEALIIKVLFLTFNINISLGTKKRFHS